MKRARTCPAVRKNAGSFPSRYLRAPPRVSSGHQEIHLVSRSGMNNVELPTPNDRFLGCFHTDIVIIGRKHPIKPTNLVRTQVHDDVDVHGGARFTVGAADHGTHQHIGNFQIFQQFNDSSKQVSLFHGSSSAPPPRRYLWHPSRDVGCGCAPRPEAVTSGSQPVPFPHAGPASSAAAPRPSHRPRPRSARRPGATLRRSSLPWTAKDQMRGCCAGGGLLACQSVSCW